MMSFYTYFFFFGFSVSILALSGVTSGVMGVDGVLGVTAGAPRGLYISGVVICAAAVPGSRLSRIAVSGLSLIYPGGGGPHLGGQYLVTSLGVVTSSVATGAVRALAREVVGAVGAWCRCIIRSLGALGGVDMPGAGS